MAIVLLTIINIAPIFENLTQLTFTGNEVIDSVVTLHSWSDGKETTVLCSIDPKSRWFQNVLLLLPYL